MVILKGLPVPQQKCRYQSALSTKLCMLGNQDQNVTCVVLLLLCWPIISRSWKFSRTFFDDFTQLQETSPVYLKHCVNFVGDFW